MKLKGMKIPYLDIIALAHQVLELLVFLPTLQVSYGSKDMKGMKLIFVIHQLDYLILFKMQEIALSNEMSVFITFLTFF